MNIDQLMSLYPNPSAGVFFVRLAEIQNSDVVITVMDLLGDIVLLKTLSGTNLQAQELDLGQKAKGIYLLKIQSGQHTCFRKIQVN